MSYTQVEAELLLYMKQDGLVPISLDSVSMRASAVCMAHRCNRNMGCTLVAIISATLYQLLMHGLYTSHTHI